MDPVEALRREGGVAGRARLAHLVSRRSLERAVTRGDVLVSRRGRYALPSVTEHRRVAHDLTATLSHLSAAQHHGWSVRTPPDRPQVVVPRNRKVTAQDQGRASVRWRALAPGEAEGGVTTALRTVLDCARDLPFDHALAVADSALRAGHVSREALGRAAGLARGPGSASVRRVAAHADGRADNPFESVLRSICLEVPGLVVTPQVQIWEPGLWAQVDLADTSLRLVLEADSFAHHGSRAALRKDCRRYDQLVIRGWTVLRFAWEHVMLEPDFVRWCLTSWVGAREGREVASPPRPLQRLA
jgi:very-short-patch-repair endonuclease